MIDTDTKYMEMALKLARRGLGAVEPNPMVGCVITKDNRIIGKGWHKKFGGPHAEVVALEACRSEQIGPQGSRMYVTLEPCCHQGKTGPCTQAIIVAGVREVIVATIDPSPHAKGKGIEQLRQAGIDVTVGLCQTEARLLNAPFIKRASTNRCWTVLKWAQSIDGKLAWAQDEVASKAEDCRWISNERSRKDVHKLRRRIGAILVGINTVLADDPLLTPRPSRGKKPIRIVLDNSLRIPLGCKLLKTIKNSPVLICTSKKAIEANPEKADKIRNKGAELLACPDSEASNLSSLLDDLSHRGVAQLLVEGGPTVLASFLRESLADEICVYISPQILGARGSADIATAMSNLNDATNLHRVDVTEFDGDVRITGITERAAQEVLNA